jgi:hypothetical protein
VELVHDEGLQIRLKTSLDHNPTTALPTPILRIIDPSTVIVTVRFPHEDHQIDSICKFAVNQTATLFESAEGPSKSPLISQ